MNATLSTQARNYLKVLIARCTEPQQLLFKRMYSHKNLDLPINEVIDNMPDEKLDWAVSQCERTVNKNN
jgi:hypothetical protein